MQVLHVFPVATFTGAERYALTLALEQKARGIDVGFAVLRGSPLEKECTKAGLPTFIIDLQAPAPIVFVAYQYHSILMRHPELQVAHLHTLLDVNRFALALQLLRLTRERKEARRRPKIIQQSHEWVHTDEINKRNPLQWISYQVVDEFWCSTESARRNLMKVLPAVPAKRIHVIHRGRNLEIEKQLLERNSAREELGLPLDAVVIGTVSRIEKTKGIWELINAAVTCMKKNDNLYLVVFGGPSLVSSSSAEFFKKVEAYVDSLSTALKSRIRMHGSTPNAVNLLRAFDIFAHPSFQDSLSLSLLEAQLAGLPVIGTTGGDTAELVREGETGWLCKPEAIDELTDSINRAIQDSSHWNSFGEIARERIRSGFDLEKILDQVIERYQIQ